MNQYLIPLLIFILGIFIQITSLIANEPAFSETNPVIPAEQTQPLNTEKQVAISETTAATKELMVVETVNPTIESTSPESMQKNETVAVVGSTPPSAVITSQSSSPSHISSSGIAIIPMFGASTYSGRWSNHIGNAYTIGIALEVPVSERFSMELEGSRAESNVTYSSFMHDFNQYTLGGNGKFYLNNSQNSIRPYLGAGILGVYFENMRSQWMTYHHWLGAGELLAGSDVRITDTLSLGARGAWIVPLFNRPQTLDNGYQSLPPYEENGAINTSFFKLMGTMKVNF